MARQIIDTGTLALNGQDGDTNREAADKCNANFSELYSQQENFVRGAGVVVAGSVAVFEGTTGNQLGSRSISDFEPAQTPGTASQYRNGLKQLVEFAASVRGAVLSGLSAASSVAITATDTVLSAFEKLQAQVTARAVKGANSDITSLSGLTTALSVEQGGTGVKSLPVIFTRLRDSQNLTYAEAASERIRMKIFEPVNFVTNVDDASNAQIRGPGYVTTTTTGTIPGGYTYGVLTTTIIPGDVVNQEFVPLSGAAGVTFPAYRRTGYGSSAGRWGPWRMVMDSATSLLDPNSGGLMSSALIGGYLVQKFANGQMCVQGQIVSPLTNPVPPNATVQVNVGLPVSFTDINNSTVKIDLPGPSVTHEHFGFTVAHLSSGSGILSYFRNGPESQLTGNLRITVWGRWK